MGTDPEPKSNKQGKGESGNDSADDKAPLRRNPTIVAAKWAAISAIVVAALTAIGAWGLPVVEAMVQRATQSADQEEPPPTGPETTEDTEPSGPPESDTPPDDPAGEEPVAASVPVGYDCSPVPDQEAVLATVVYTEDMGLNAFCGPANTYPRATPSNYPESETIAIVCQVRDGQAWRDTDDVPGRYTGEWTVWNKLSNGAWVHDLYVDTPKEEDQAPPEGIALCDGPS
ncbi:hypothetical protein [Thermobifida cellulosilytica]|uniref:Uncharacterized protein n=1 Tax=Thermobifida cellulosilytica TB100 TaxID=665004 RepID=A0A147KIN9_THECS|nr:hypothetical protein [Thermobifida cellulosilytica]KUP97165.1 hypothetical protein AC529_08385 [Thermobifida cellulosilytica TB100]